MKPSVSLEARNPYELRLDLSAAMSEADVREALASGDMGFIHSYTTGSAVDGPGVRVVAWTSGCMWRCRYCHNPDTWKLTNGLPVTIDRAVDALGAYKHGLKVMSGGFTLSGGEPLMQHRFAAKLLAAVKAQGIHTCIETNGYFSDKLRDDELAAIDLVMLGIKTWGDERHKDLTGMEVSHTLAFARRLAALGKPVWIRFVLVPGLTDDPAIASGIADFAASLGNIQRVEVLPFHQMGRFKWHELGLDYTLESTEPPPVALCDQTVAIFRNRGLTAY